MSGSPTASTGGEAIRTGVSVARQKKGVGEGGRTKEQSKQFLGGHAFGDPPTGVSQGRLVTMGEDPERKIKMELILLRELSKMKPGAIKEV